MAATADNHPSKCHVLNFFYDDDNGCALTVLVNETRFHIVVDHGKLHLEPDGETGVERQYLNLLRAVRDNDEKEHDPREDQRRKDLEEAEQHKPDGGTDTQQPSARDSAIGSSPLASVNEKEEEEKDSEDGEECDSAVDVEEHDTTKEKTVAETQSAVLVADDAETSDPAHDLHHWILSPFGEVFERLAPSPNTRSQRSVYDWYHAPTHFFCLELKNGALFPVELKSTVELERRMDNLIPRLSMPKYIKNLGIPWVHPSKLNVLQEGDQPEPLHPTIVKRGEEVFFLKVVDVSQPQPTKREIKLLNKIEKLGLHKELNIPQVLGLVGTDNSKTDIMGFLLSVIDNPKPLTTLLDSKIPHERREKWAKQSQRMVDILHGKNIVWGDAKADNFLVDKNDDLWIIDFGGSYTEGWVEGELMETEQGDDMGMEKVVNALDDPEANTFDPASSVQQRKPASETRGTSKHRTESNRNKRALDTNETGSRKRQKSLSDTVS